MPEQRQQMPTNPTLIATQRSYDGFKLCCGIAGLTTSVVLDEVSLRGRYEECLAAFLPAASTLLTAVHFPESLGTIVSAAGLAVSARITRRELQETFFPLCMGIALRCTKSRRRILVGISGPAGAGKSVMSKLLELLLPIAAQYVNIMLTDSPPEVTLLSVKAVAVGVDGYHRRNAYIREAGLHLHKGRPETFDGTAFTMDVGRLRDAWTANADVALPAYDRHLHEPVAGAIVVPAAVGVVIIEGILLFTPAFGADTADLFDVRLWLNMDETQAKARVNGRKIAGGRSHADVEEHYGRVDGPNFIDMIQHRGRADVTFEYISEDGQLGEWLPSNVSVNA